MPLRASLLLLAAATAAAECPLPAPLAPLSPPAELEARASMLAARLDATRDPLCGQQLALAGGRAELASGRAGAATPLLTLASLGPERELAARSLLLLGEAYRALGEDTRAFAAWSQASRLGATADAAVRSRALARVRVARVAGAEPAWRVDPGWSPGGVQELDGRALAVGPDGSLAVVEKKRLLLLEANGALSAREQLDDARGVGFDHGGGLWVAGKRGLERSGSLSLTDPLPDDLDDVAVDRWGRVALIIDGDAWLYPGSGQRQPLGRADRVVARPQGFALLERDAERVWLWPEQLELQLLEQNPPLAKPEALACDRFGHLAVLDTRAQAIVIVDPDGQRLAWIGRGPERQLLRRARDLAFAPDGALYLLADKGRQLVRLD